MRFLSYNIRRRRQNLKFKLRKLKSTTILYIDKHSSLILICLNWDFNWLVFSKTTEFELRPLSHAIANNGQFMFASVPGKCSTSFNLNPFETKNHMLNYECVKYSFKGTVYTNSEVMLTGNDCFL